jgi:hypothetical protein
MRKCLRWSLEPIIEQDGSINMAAVYVRTPFGTGPGAYSRVVVTGEFAEWDYRRAMAFAVRAGRESASEWRRQKLA